MPAKKSSTVTLTSKEFEELKELARLPNESPNPVIRISTTGKLLFASKFAYTIDRMIDPKTDQVAPELMKAAKASFKDGKTTRVDYIDDGVIYELFISPVKEHGYINLYGRDVTEIRETMAQVKDLAKFPSENPNPVVRSSSDGSVLFANDAARALNGIILAGPPEKLTKALSQAAQSASKLKIFVKVNHTSGGQTYLFTFMPVKGEAYLNVYGREITAEIEAQNALKESNAQLEKRVAERTASVRLLQNIVLAANSADSLEAALQTALHEVCIYTGWPVGHAYVVERQEDHIRLIPTGLWHIETSTKYSDLRAATETHRFGEADGLPGRAIRSGQAEWVEYLSRDKKSVRATFAKQAGLSSGMAFPVVSDGIVIGVLEFFSQKRTAANVEIIETMGHIGTQLGSVAKRKNAENAAASSQKEAATAHARLSNAIDVMAQGFVLFDKDDRIVLFNKGYSDFIVDFSGEAPATGDTFEEIIRSSSKFAGERLSNDERDQSIKRVLSDRKASKVENTVQRTSSGRWLQIEGFDTAEGGAVSVFTDITETKEHEQELGRLADQADLAHARLRDAIESIGQGFALFDADDRIVLFN
ncbi:MAG: PAS domain-containing protein, partial [Paracoccaceae bacterium]